MDYRELKLIASTSPHIRSKNSARTLMVDVIIALLPALAFSVYNFGWRALSLTAVSMAGCVGFEALYRYLTGKHQTVGDLSAAVTGMLIAFVSPVTLPYWTILIADGFAIILVKQLFGGIGKNFMNPALAARAFLFSWGGAMSHWVVPGSRLPVWGPVTDAVTYATPMSFLHTNDLEGLKAIYTPTNMLLGQIGGSLGEVSALLLIFGGVFLLLRRVIAWYIPASYIGTVAALTLLFPRGNEPVEWMVYNLLGGGLMLGAFFMATDFVTSPVTRRGQVIFGVGCGLLTVFIRYFGAYSEGVCYSILVMNLCVWLIDKYVKPHHFGVPRAARKKEAAAK